MTNNNKINNKSILVNTSRSNNAIKLSMYRGVISGNIIEEPIIPPVINVCETNALDFSCPENSQYIGAI